jgi:hypothetical protein
VHRTAIIIVLVYFNISLQWRNTVKPRIGMRDTRSEYERRDIYATVFNCIFLINCVVLIVTGIPSPLIGIKDILASAISSTNISREKTSSS